MNNEGNIILAQIIDDIGTIRKTKELIPENTNKALLQSLVKDQNDKIYWSPLTTGSMGPPGQTLNVYNNKGRVGIGRMPLHGYKLDIDTEQNKKTTALHIGDGVHGFSLGNGTDSGFLPEIIGVGKDENDAGLYFVGIAGNNKESNIPLIVFDGRNMYAKQLTNRPIFGVISENYNEFDFLIDSEKNVHVKDIILENQSLLQIINELREEIKLLKK